MRVGTLGQNGADRPQFIDTTVAEIPRYKTLDVMDGMKLLRKHHDTLRLRFKNYLREARKTLGMPVECNAAVMLKMLDASYEHLTPADVGEFEELLHLGDDYEFISRVKSNYLASDNVTELAGVCGYSSTITFRRRFQRVFGCSASSWLRQRRIERIGELLRTTHYTLQEIAYMCGFSAQSHFTDFCKRNMGSNPTSIRQEGLI